MSSPLVTLSESKFIMARRRINIALAILEDGIYDLLTTEDVTHILASAVADLDEAHVIEEGNGARVLSQSGIDWDAWAAATGE